MNRAALAVTIAFAVGCGSGSTRELERKVDELARDQHDVREVERKLAELTAKLISSEVERLTLAHKLEELDDKQQKLEAQLAAQPAPTPRPPTHAAPDSAKTYAIAIAPHDPSLGSPDAKVTIVEAYDYACPYCERVRDTLADLRQHYGADLRIVYKSYIVHPQVATANALAACAAHKQKRFAELDAILWDKGFKGRSFDKDDPSGARCWDAPAGCPIALGYALDLGLDVARLQRDMTACKPLVDAEMAELSAFGVGATPSFFINGRFTAGAMPAADFERLIDEELAKANDRIKHGASAKTYYQQWVVGKGEKTL